MQTYRAPELLNALGSTSRIVPVPGTTDLLCRNRECLLLPRLLAASSFRKHVQGHPPLQDVFPELTCKTTYLSNL